MSRLDTIFRPLATRLLAELSGQTVTYRRKTFATYDPDTSSATPTDATSTVHTYAEGPNKRARNGAVLRCDLLFYLSAQELAFEPKSGDEIVYRGDTYTVPDNDAAGGQAVEVISSGEADALYLVAGVKG